VDNEAIYGTVGVLVGAGGLLVGAGERRGRKRAEARDVASAARALQAETHAMRAEARAELAEAREIERLERERGDDVPWLRLDSFRCDDRSDGRPVFKAVVTNFGSCSAAVTRLEVWKDDAQQAPRAASAAHAIESQEQAQLTVAVPPEWTVDDGRSLAPGVQARVFDEVTHAEVSIHA
jgi:hypothetical protein